MRVAWQGGNFELGALSGDVDHADEITHGKEQQRTSFGAWNAEGAQMACGANFPSAAWVNLGV
jgi:hypothetical protein